MAAQLEPAEQSPWNLSSALDPDICVGFEKLLQDHGPAGIAGWKLGANDLPMRRRWNIEHCLLGVIPAGNVHVGHRDIDVRNLACPAVEPELCFHIGRDITSGMSSAEIVDAISGVSLAAEVIDIAGRLDNPGEVVARNIFHSCFVRDSAVCSLHDYSKDKAVVVASRNDEPLWSIPVGYLLPEAPVVVRFVSQFLCQFGLVLRAGEIVMSGVLTPVPVWISEGDKVSVREQDIGEVEICVVNGGGQDVV